jgi:DivIVA domain-containing protein
MTHKRFPRSVRWRRGYHRRQVDSFLANVELSLQGALPPMAASDIRRAGFELVRHGYAVAAVDAHLDELEEQVLVVEGATSGRRGRTDPESDVQFLCEQLEAPHMRRFPRSRMWRRGYDLDQVDDFVDRVLASFDALANKGAPRDNAVSALGVVPTLSVEDVRGTGFKPRRGGYAELAVDETLDRVVEVLLVHRRVADKPLTGHPPEQGALSD